MVVSFNRLLFRIRQETLLKQMQKPLLQGLAQIVLDDKLRGADPNPEGANAYPIVSLTWILAYPESKTGVKETLRYMLSEKSQSFFQILWDTYLSQSLFDRKHLLLLTLLNKNSIMGNIVPLFYEKESSKNVRMVLL